MRDKYNHMDKLMLTFTYKDDNKYFKMQVINEIKNYFTKLVRNTKSEDIKYFSNIELGSNFDNPHLHIQVWHKNLDQVKKIRDKVIDRFKLNKEYCNASIPKYNEIEYDYVVKDYKIKDIALMLELDRYKKDYRLFLGKNLRFNSFSKEKYTKSVYKNAYKKGINKDKVDYLIDNCIIDKNINIIDNRVIKIIVLLLLMQYIEQVTRLKSIDLKFRQKESQIPQQLFNYWIFGFL